MGKAEIVFNKIAQVSFGQRLDKFIANTGLPNMMSGSDKMVRGLGDALTAPFVSGRTVGQGVDSLIAGYNKFMAPPNIAGRAPKIEAMPTYKTIPAPFRDKYQANFTKNQ